MVHFYTPWISRGAKWNIGVKWVSDAVLVTWILLLLLLLSLLLLLLLALLWGSNICWKSTVKTLAQYWTKLFYSFFRWLWAFTFVLGWQCISDACSEPCQVLKMELFVKIFNCWKSFTSFAKTSPSLTMTSLWIHLSLPMTFSIIYFLECMCKKHCFPSDSVNVQSQQ